MDVGQALFTMARVYDAGHIFVCKNRSLAQRKKPHDEALLTHPVMDVSRLSQQIVDGYDYCNSEVTLQQSAGRRGVLEASWTLVVPMSFDHLPVLDSLGGLLPGETRSGRYYAGIGGGGGSDVISASLLGHLLRASGKEMNLVVSTRTWRTGSQGAKGSKMGIRREIHQHGGQAMLNNSPVPGTYRVTKETYSEGRDLETVPVGHHKDIYLVLDQGEEGEDIDEHERSQLEQQFRAVMAQHQTLDTIIAVDTGGDVFGADSTTFSTPDQDLRVQRALSHLSNLYPSLVTAVLAPGVDAPSNAPDKAQMAGGKVYKLSSEEKDKLLGLLGGEYRMDGSDTGRFGKTTLSLQEALKGIRGWACLNLPGHVVDTWENPWSCFVYIRDCMTDIVLMPLEGLLPLIEAM
ncbi:hypothetical protein PV10_07712 [Exophiala mesophila]|uniref:Uncharacterized protein n=1 Tax=Exophiala mesophila TaxID=212818 RepID=A0A0D1Z6D4_EXOME|nr:uncharacterized protein PV10_07712 [Exophiala mesophila]KIV90402.1 hypothetical protein PV10_07712 [Exophiala mesophila]